MVASERSDSFNVSIGSSRKGLTVSRVVALVIQCLSLYLTAACEILSLYTDSTERSSLPYEYNGLVYSCDRHG